MTLLSPGSGPKGQQEKKNVVSFLKLRHKFASFQNQEVWDWERPGLLDKYPNPTRAGLITRGLLLEFKQGWEREPLPGIAL